MAKIPFSFGGGGGDSSDDCTAEAADVLESKTAIYNGSDDDALEGTMKDYSGTSTQATGSMNSSSSRVQMAIPNTGKYDTAANLYVPYSTMRTLIGYTDASKVLTGTTICGLAGTMADKSGTSTAATSSVSGSNVRLQIPTNAYYNTSAYLTNSYTNMASTIGLTAAKIKYGETILGITGTWQGWVATSGDLYYNGAVGTIGGSISVVNTTYISLDTSCISVNPNKSRYSYNVGVVFGTAINCAQYSKATVTYTVNQAGTNSATSADRIWIGFYTSKPSDTSSIAYDQATVYARSSWLSSTGTNLTLSCDLSSYTQTLYCAVGCSFNASSSYNSWSGTITRIALS